MNPLQPGLVKIVSGMQQARRFFDQFFTRSSWPSKLDKISISLFPPNKGKITVGPGNGCHHNLGHHPTIRGDVPD
jgi:hypothetical protein